MAVLILGICTKESFTKSVYTIHNYINLIASMKSILYIVIENDSFISKFYIHNYNTKHKLTWC